MVTIPPCFDEVEALLMHFSKHGVKFVIGDTLAVIKHLHPYYRDMRAGIFRPISKILLVISPKLPPIPESWEEVLDELGNLLWISPSRGYVQFQEVNNIDSISLDEESATVHCPVMDFKTVFVEKLKVKKHRDLLDLLSLADSMGIPENLETELLNEDQRKNLNRLKQWLKRRLAKEK